MSCYALVSSDRIVAGVIVADPVWIQSDPPSLRQYLAVVDVGGTLYPAIVVGPGWIWVDGQNFEPPPDTIDVGDTE